MVASVRRAAHRPISPGSRPAFTDIARPSLDAIGQKNGHLGKVEDPLPPSATLAVPKGFVFGTTLFPAGRDFWRRLLAQFPWMFSSNPLRQLRWREQLILMK
jgi:hypothetical protein